MSAITDQEKIINQLRNKKFAAEESNAKFAQDLKFLTLKYNEKEEEIKKLKVLNENYEKKLKQMSAVTDQENIINQLRNEKLAAEESNAKFAQDLKLLTLKYDEKEEEIKRLKALNENNEKKLAEIHKLLSNNTGMDVIQKSSNENSAADDSLKRKDLIELSNVKSEKRKSKEDHVQQKKTKLDSFQNIDALREVKHFNFAELKVESKCETSGFLKTLNSIEKKEQNYTGPDISEKKETRPVNKMTQLFSHLKNSSKIKTLCKSKDVLNLIINHAKTENLYFNCFEMLNNVSQNDLIRLSTSLLNKLQTDEVKYNPLKILNEIYPGLVYTVAEENNKNPSKRFRITVEISGQIYEGIGQNKKQAKSSAALAVLSNMYNFCYNICSSASNAALPLEETIKHFPQTLANKIAELMKSTFDDIMSSNKAHAKWRVIAGIAMTNDEDMQNVQIITIGTGSKCINGDHISMMGVSLNDCHAEIISRRCLKDFLYTNLELHQHGKEGQSIFMKRETSGYLLKPQVKFHLYISTAPCGDARVFCFNEKEFNGTPEKQPKRKTRGCLRTKIECGMGTLPTRSKQVFQTWDGILSGETRLLTMSCSAKILAWNVLGLQGALLSHFIEPIYLDSIILEEMFYPHHLKRAIYGRIEKVIKDLPLDYRLNRPKLGTVTSSQKESLKKAPNFSINWTYGLEQAEIINTSTGKKENGEISRISKRSLFQRFLNLNNNISLMETSEVPHPYTYSSFKNDAKSYQEAKSVLIASFLEVGLGSWIKKPAEQNDFTLAF